MSLRGPARSSAGPRQSNPFGLRLLRHCVPRNDKRKSTYYSTANYTKIYPEVKEKILQLFTMSFPPHIAVRDKLQRESILPWADNSVWFTLPAIFYWYAGSAHQSLDIFRYTRYTLHAKIY